MKLDRYLFAELLRPSLLGLAFYTFVLVMNQLFLIVRQAFQRGSDPIVVVELLGLALPKILVLTIPMASLFGLLIGLGRLSADSEIVALRAAGVSHARMARAAFALGFTGFVASVILYNLVVPWTHARTQDLKVSVFRTLDPNREIHAGVFYDEIPDTLVFADEVDHSDPAWPLRKVLVRTERLEVSGSGTETSEEFASSRGESPAEERPAASAQEKRRPDEDDQAGNRDSAEEPPEEELEPLETILCGEKARIELSADASQARVYVNLGEIHQTDPAHPGLYRRVQFKRPFTAIVALTNSGTRLGVRKQTVQESTLRELIEEARHFKPKRVPGNPERAFRHRRALMEIHWRFAVPFAAIAFCMLGFPLGLVTQRGGKASGFAVSLIVVTMYWIALTVGRDLVLERRIPVLIGAWGPNVLVLACAALLLAGRRRASRVGFPRIIQERLTALQGRLASGIRRSRSADGVRPALPLSTPTPPPRPLVLVLDRYLTRRYLSILALVLLSALALFAVVEIRSVVDSLIHRPLPVMLALQYFLFLTPGMLKIILPIASVVAVLITVGILCRHSEDTALKAAGVSVFRISAPLLVTTAALCALYYVVQDYVAPQSNQSAARVRDEIEGRIRSVAVDGTRWMFGQGKRLYGYEEYDPANRVLQGVSILEIAGDPFRIRRRTWSPRVSWQNGVWTANEGWARSFGPDTETMVVLDRTPFALPETPEDFSSRERSLLRSNSLSEEMSFVALRGHIRRMKHSGFDTTRLRVALYEKSAFPFAPLVMVLIGLPFAFRTGRRGALYGMGIALGLVFVYWACFAVSSALGHEEILPAVLAAWSPNLLFGIAGTYMLLSTRS